MPNYDLVSIVGLPRSGTTFLWRMLRIIFQQGCSEVRDTQTSLISTGENVAVGSLLRYGGDPWSYVRQLIVMWRRLLADENRTIVFKQPQLVFAAPPHDLSVFSIVCVRENYEFWKQSWLDHGGHGQIDPFQRPADYLRDTWPFEWGTPEDTDDRIEIYYTLYMNAARELLKSTNACLWTFERPLDSLHSIWSALMLDPGHIPNVIREFRPRKRKA